MSADREAAIIQVAEDMVRHGGYNSFSFRNIASAIGIKSSSVHYHFSTKEHLGVAVTKHYTDKFIASLGNACDLVASGKDPINIYVKAFRKALSQDKGMCLCGMLGAEADVLPERVINETRQFFVRNIAWLETAYRAKGVSKGAKEKAVQAISLLEGAMLTSNVMGDSRTFDLAAKLLIQ